MSQNSKQSSSRAKKRSRFAGNKKSRSSPLILLGVLVAVLFLIGGTIVVLKRPSAAAAADVSSATAGDPSAGDRGSLVKAATHGHDPYPLAVAESDTIRFPLATFDDFKAHHYTYMHEGRPVEFFILKSTDGVVRAAFNACDVCFRSKKGYTQDGDVVICNNCDRRFPADEINVVQGGCNPSPLNRTTEGDTLIIHVEDILAGSTYF